MRAFPLLLILACGYGVLLRGQTVSLQNSDLGAYRLKQPILAGIAGDRIFVIDMPERGQTPLFIFDSTLQLTKKVFLPEGAYLSRILAMDHAIQFSWLPVTERKSDSATIVINQVSPEGIVTAPAKINISERPGVTPALISDRNNKYQLLYAFEARDSNKVLFQGLLLDTAGRALKQLSYTVDFERAFNQAPYVTLDTRGNIHILVVDRLTSYRLSSTIRVNTIPFGEEAISSESFDFERVKFNLLALTDDPATQTIRLQGLYYDGQQKNRKGLASLSFTYQRGQPFVEPRFIPFPDHLRAQLRKNLPHLRSKDDPLNSMRLQGILVQDGQTVFTYFLHDISEVDLRSDFEEDAKSDIVTPRYALNAQVPTPQESLSRWLNDAERLNKSMVYNSSSVSVYFLPEFIPQRYPTFAETSAFNPVVGRGITDEDRQRAFDRLDRDSRTNYDRTGKLVSFHFASSGEWDKYSILNPTFLFPHGEDRVGMITYPLLFENELYFTGGTVSVDEKSQFSLVHPNKLGEPDLHLFAFPFPLNSRISKPIRARQAKYVALVKERNLTNYGLLMYEIK